MKEHLLKERLKEIKAELKVINATLSALCHKPKAYRWTQRLFERADMLASEAEELAVSLGRAPKQPTPPKRGKKAA